jgi:hypothetical protein
MAPRRPSRSAGAALTGSVSAPAYSAAAFTDMCRSALVAVATGPTPTVAALTGAGRARFAAAFAVVATAGVPAGESGLDARRFAPAGSRWTAEELSDVVEFLSLVPLSRAVVGLADVHRMDRTQQDRLLTVLESPHPSTVVLLAMPETGSVPATLLARCNRTVALTVALAGDELSRLEAAGLDGALLDNPVVAPLVVDLCATGLLERFAAMCADLAAAPARAPFSAAAVCADIAADLTAATGETVTAAHVVDIVLAQVAARLAALAVDGPLDAGVLAALAAGERASRSSLAAGHQSASSLAPYLQRLAVAFDRSGQKWLQLSS